MTQVILRYSILNLYRGAAAPTGKPAKAPPAGGAGGKNILFFRSSHRQGLRVPEVYSKTHQNARGSPDSIKIQTYRGQLS
jgi:hypothetical protein